MSCLLIFCCVGILLSARQRLTAGAGVADRDRLFLGDPAPLRIGLAGDGISNATDGQFRAVMALDLGE